AARRRHAAHFVALAEAAEPALRRSAAAAWQARLTEEQANVAAALAWAEETREAALGLRLAAALGRFWHDRGFTGAERRRVEALVALSEAADDEGDRATAVAVGAAHRAAALVTAGLLALRHGDVDRAGGCYEAALALQRAGPAPGGPSGDSAAPAAARTLN